MEQKYRARAVAQQSRSYAVANTFGHHVASSFELDIVEPRTGSGLERRSFLGACLVCASSRAIRSIPKHERWKNEIRR